jgi:NTE family protein
MAYLEFEGAEKSPRIVRNKHDAGLFLPRRADKRADRRDSPRGARDRRDVLMRSESHKPPLTGLILAGGGARAAYQVGVLKAIADVAPAQARNPFPIICGTSAGAINGAALAIDAARFHYAVKRLVRVWQNFHVHHVFRADALGIAKSGAHWLTALLAGGLGRFNPHALLDREPLEQLLRRHMPCHLIQNSIDSGALRAFSVTAAGYTTAQSVTFYQGAPGIVPWKRARRVGLPTRITEHHLMASSAIPFLFRGVKLEREYFGDGSLRQIAPISPALHLGADRVLVIGVRHDLNGDGRRPISMGYPSLADLAGYVLDSIFLDALEADLERLRRINKTISLIPSHHLVEAKVTLRPVDVLVIAPSEDINRVAAQHARELPRTIRLLLRGLGAMKRRGSSLVSYLLFEEGYTRALIDLGYRDTMQRADEVRRFLGFDAV